MSQITRAQLIAETENLLATLQSQEPANEPKSLIINGMGEAGSHHAKTLTDAVVGGSEYARAAVEWKNVGRQKVDLRFETKADFTTVSTGSDSFVNYQGYAGQPVLVPSQSPSIRSLLATGETTMGAVPYHRETAYTNAATSVAEGDAKPEATITLEDVIAPVKKIAVFLKVTDEMWADFPSLRSFLEGRLRLMVQQREDALLLNGNGVGANLTGILATSGIQTQPKGADTDFDAVHKAITKINASPGFGKADAVVINPTDWEVLRLEKDMNDQYYGGGPLTGQYGSGGIAVDRLWGLPAVVTTAITAGTALVGAFRASAQVFDRTGLTIEMTNSDADDFQNNLMSIRVEQRLALAVYQPLGFCTVTGL